VDNRILFSLDEAGKQDVFCGFEGSESLILTPMTLAIQLK
jgi:hypothetical protein